MIRTEEDVDTFQGERPAWFASLFGFQEDTRRGAALHPHTCMEVDRAGGRLRSLANGREFGIGHFSMPSLGELRAQGEALWPRPPGVLIREVANCEHGPTIRDGGLTLRHVPIRDVYELHTLPQNMRATFQVASQFNCLEFTNDEVTPEDGVTGYASDATQGPACALATAPATVFRNYFVPMGNGHDFGQTACCQLNSLAGVLEALNTTHLVEMRNGYVRSDPDSVRELNQRIQEKAGEREAWLERLQIGVHSPVEVPFAPGPRFTLTTPEGLRPEVPQLVSQVFCSAIPVFFPEDPEEGAENLWAPLASAVLEAAYEATLLSAAVELKSGVGSGTVYLTSLGAGSFGNPNRWIERAIIQACERLSHVPLDIVLLHHGAVDRDMRLVIDEALEEVAEKTSRGSSDAAVGSGVSAEALQRAREQIAAGRYVPPQILRAVQAADVLAVERS